VARQTHGRGAGLAVSLLYDLRAELALAFNRRERKPRARARQCPARSPRRLPVAKSLPPKCSANASASSGLDKQNTTTSLWSRRMEYVSGVAERRPAAQKITSRFTGSRSFSTESAA
jgi:hypothetical protein